MKRFVFVAMCFAFVVAISAQDGRFIKNSEGIIKDNKTGILWMSGGTYQVDFRDAQLRSAALRAGRYIDWRLPTINEFKALVDQYSGDTAAAWLNLYGFNIMDGYYWTSDGSFDPFTRISYYKCVSFTTLEITSTMQMMKSFYLFVRDASKDVEFVSSFTIDNGTIIDNALNLMWLQVVNQTNLSWNAANEYCKSLSNSGYTDWRLPSLSEMQNLLRQGLPNIPSWLVEQGFICPNTDDYCWTSTECPNIDYAYAVTISSCYKNGVDKKFGKYPFFVVRQPTK
jgi:hypothetical protein